MHVKMPGGMPGTQEALTKSFVLLKMVPGFCCSEACQCDITMPWELRTLSLGRALPPPADPTPVWLTEMSYLRQHPPPAALLQASQPLPSLSGGQHRGQGPDPHWTSPALTGADFLLE